MKTTLLLSVLLLVSVGCVSTTAKVKDIEVSRTSVFTRSEADVEWVQPDGTRVTVRAKSDPAAEALKAVAEGAAAGAARGANPLK